MRQTFSECGLTWVGAPCLVSTRVKELPESAIYTAQFIEHFDALFNTFNSCSFKCSQRLGPTFNDSSGHRAFLWESLSLLDNVKAMDGKELPYIQGWKISINGLLGLWHYLKTEQQFQFLLTRKLNQDCAENLFSMIRGRGGYRDNPDPQQFKETFKYVVADKLFVQSSYSNCKVAGDKILLDISALAMARYEKLEPPTQVVLMQLSKSGDEYCQFLKCQSIKCSLRLKSMVKLYMKVRLFHALKQSNIQNVEDKSGKCNRKMLKISHL